jgi:hypothetical protein
MHVCGAQFVARAVRGTAQRTRGTFDVRGLGRRTGGTHRPRETNGITEGEGS